MAENNVSSFLKKIGNIRGEDVAVFLPSIQDTIDIPPLNFKQQKDIIACTADGIAGIISFTRIINNIILDGADSPNHLRVYDRVPIIVALRVNALGHQYKTDADESVDLLEVLNNINKSTKHEKIKDTIEYNGIRVSVAVPTLQEENVFIKKLEDEVKRNGDNNSKNLGSIYIYEIIKYIVSVEYDGINIDCNDLKIGEKVELIEGLPLALNKKVIAFIETFKKEEKEMLTVDGVTVDINPGFFSTD